jgi:hypothetical protein
LLLEYYKIKFLLKLDILEKKVIFFDCFQCRGEAYGWGELHISPFESSWQIPEARTGVIRTTDIPSQKDDGIYTCVEPRRQGCQEPCGRIVKGRPGVLYRNHITPLDKQ